MSTSKNTWPSAALLNLGPAIIGATGGSGTRVVARIVRAGGMFIGTHLNVSEDALDFGAYSDRWINTFTEKRNVSSEAAIDKKMTSDLKRILEKHCAPINESPQPWGWKEPRSIYLLPFFHSQFPNLKFLHVVRDGRDMAFSTNQNQLKKHGGALLNWREKLMSRPLQSITQWSRVNLMAADFGEKNLGEQYLRIRFEDLCSQPTPSIQRIFTFFGLTGDAQEIGRLELAPPASIGRWQNQNAKTRARLETAGETALRRFGYLNTNITD